MTASNDRTDMTEADDVPGWGAADPEAFRRLARIWDALGAGPLWLDRDTSDPFVEPAPPARPEALRTTAAAAPARPEGVRPMPAFAASLRPAPTAPVPAGAQGRAPARPTPAAPVAKAPELSAETLDAISKADWTRLGELAQKCSACPMAKSRQHVVFAQGEPGPKLVLVGEAPGSEEDLQGLPFVGKSGQLLTAMLDAVAVRRAKDVVILNALKCRPPQNRNPEPQESACCAHWLKRQLELLSPKVLFLMGRFAVQTVLKLGDAPRISALRGKVHDVTLPDGSHAKAVVTYHPSYLLRSPHEKAKAWEDLVLLRRTMREAGVEVREREKSW